MGTDLPGGPGTDAKFGDGFLDAIRLIAETRRRAYSIRTEQAHEHWACRFIAFCRNRDPRELGAAEVTSRETTGKRTPLHGRG